MRVLRLTPFFHHDCVTSWPAEFDAVGGMQSQILRLSRELAGRGVRQQVLTLGFPGLPRVRVDAPNLVVRITRAPLPRLRSELTGLVGLNQAWLVAALAECVRLRATWRPDLIHVHADGQLWALLAGPAASRVLGAPYCVTLHCSRLSVYQPMSRVDQLQHRLVVAAEKWALRRASGVSTLTDRTAAVVASALAVDRADIEVVPDAVDTESTVDGSAARDLLARLGVPAGHRVVGYVGRVAHEKGWPDFVRLARELAARPVTFLVVGDGPQSGRMREEVAAAGLVERFRFTGFLPHHDIPTVMAGLDALVMPSRHEELGGSALEAMLAGTPVVAYAVGGLRDTVGHVTPSLLVPPSDVSALATAVRAVLDDPHIYRAQVAAGRSWLTDQFDGGAVARRVIAHYERVLAGTATLRSSRGQG
ncbi:glycosyltransferase family 4 protein [Streptoalloteichus hindustanus]|uniref:2-deoxystreptamine N-acetyl-D-glucosaminyltransferase n=1 Tax=Streptoalloteichus hindustanus TaxID=2017 RepID=A0A1M4Z228_STRHI|nr:glycosyltransferase family 4 protein [Streptoalloteichus hindustanus]SHF12119.1 2-deoxystreptamine N-acetyl-D-glucosaminyltransferase / 2-deoxystreptamine glucosyltransferase [Streptoalloteichus hindustanus]